MRSKTLNLGFSLLVLGLLTLAILVEDAVQAFEDPASATEHGLVEQLALGGSGVLRQEGFRLVPRGARWAAERTDLGVATLLLGSSSGRPQVELELAWTDTGTRLRRVLRGLEAPGTWSYVYREWRTTGEGRVDGRGLVLDAEGDGLLRLREWSGPDQLSEDLPVRGGVRTPLAVLEQRRSQRGPLAVVEHLFEPIEGRVVPVVLVETPLAPGLLPGLRLVDLHWSERAPGGGLRPTLPPTRWLLWGTEVLGFLEGDLEGIRTPPARLLAAR